MQLHRLRLDTRIIDPLTTLIARLAPMDPRWKFSTIFSSMEALQNHLSKIYRTGCHETAGHHPSTRIRRTGLQEARKRQTLAQLDVVCERLMGKS